MDTPPKNLHPHFAFDLNSQLVDELLFESLIVLGENSLPHCTRLCRYWEFTNPTELLIVLSEKLIKGELKFSDNTPITPQDILTSLEIMKHEENPFQGAFNIITTATFQSPHKLVLKLKNPKPSLLVDLVLVKILPSHQATFPKTEASQLIGSGPYFLRNQNPNTLWFALNPHYGHTTPYPALQIQFIRDEQTRLFKLMKKEVDALFNATPLKSAARFKKEDSYTVLTAPGWNISYLGINHQDPLLQDLSVRKYLYQSLNIDELIKYKLHDFGIKHFSLLPIDSPFLGKSQRTPSFESSFSKKEKNRLKDRFKHSPLTLKTSNQSSVMSLVRVIQSQLHNKGIKVIHKPLEFGALMADLKAGNFQLSYGKFVGITDPAVFYDFLHSNFIPPNGRNRGRFKNNPWDELSQKLSEETDHNRRNQLSQKLQALLTKELPLIPLWVTQNIITLRKGYSLSKVSPRQSLRDFMNLYKIPDKTKRK